ncbi:hypothetical protein ASZ90_001018 [hydrocarbon metagenome]|uniref:Outer membrane homotrimeric porin n=1 Tax=hydrocarbon metagenome TaxID=938273 RepID=A0A0W8G7W3_9ZZZZ
MTLALAAILVLGCFASAQAATEVKMTGDFRVYGNWWSGRNFTGWANQFNGGVAAGTRTEDNFGVNQRFRLRTDFVANEALKFRLGIRVNNQWWGRGTLTADAPAVSIDVYQAFLQFKWPDTDIEITAGRQPFAIPQSKYFDGSLVFDSEAAALIITAPLVPDTLGLLIGYSRFYDDGQWDATTTQVADELDLFFMALPITLDGFSVTPWTALGVAGRNAGYNFESAANLVSPGFLAPGWRHRQNAYWWLGGAIEVDALDPIKFYADVIYGQGAMNDRSASKRHGWFIDAAIEYTGWDILTPSVFGWWSTGEDGSWRNGSERMPYTFSSWNGGTSFLFDGGQELGADSNMYMNPVGSWGLGLSLKNISFIEKLTHRITFVYVQGTNSSRAFRNINYANYAINAAGLAVPMTGAFNRPAYYGVDYTYPGYTSNGLFTMGRDLTASECVFGLSFDHKYMIYENLAAIIETGWAHGNFQKSVWGPRLANKAADAWRVAFGLQYKF